MSNNTPIRIKTISAFHALRNLPSPEHPLISIVRAEDIRDARTPVTLVQDYYSISLKRNFKGKFRYGQQQYDFDEGLMVFVAPGQVFRIEHGPDETDAQTGWLLLVHPDFLWNTPLAKTIRQYEFFGYAVAEALFLSEKEEATMVNILQNIQDEYHANIDAFSQGIIIAQLETLLRYSQRFYQRQFITRRISNHQVLERLSLLLDEYFAQDDLVNKGLPSVQYISNALNLSPGYLSGLLKTLTGQSTQQHIHEKLIEKAKEQLSTTTLSVSEIAYALGFGHPQSFSKLFKTKTTLSPLEFRQSFN
ncbi:MAG: AraC family transcriptional regulator [Sphingobacteriales bacterium]|nr:MAG: AraC family transcriptional regulator [Sphingobacteriales bacterium]